MPSFHDFPLQPATRSALATMEITVPTPIQTEAIPALLAGKDLLGQSATGSGKTLAYGIPLVERLARDKRIVQALVLVPTRELAVQVHAVLGKLASSRRLSTALLVGGRSYGPQLSALQYGSQIVIGTPGRVKDHLDSGNLTLSHVRICILDEADQMLDSGFAPIIEEILASTPATRQMAFFSATIPDWIETLQQKFLKDPVKIAISLAPGEQSTIEQITYKVPQEQKIAALCTLLHSARGESSLIFGRTKFGVEKLGKQLSTLGYKVGTLHSNKSQRAREEVLSAFRNGQVQTLLATNVAARGLDIQGIYQVINYELPESSELFTHRIGRTGRMGRQGKAITLLAPGDIPKWRRMAHNLGQVVAMQQLVIDEEAIAARPQMSPEPPHTQEHVQRAEPSHDRSAPRQERERQARPKQERPTLSDTQERQARPKQERPTLSDTQERQARPKQERHTLSERGRRENASRRTPSRASTPEWFPLPERPRSRKAKNVRKGAEKPTGKTMGKRAMSAFVDAAPQRRRKRA